MGLEQQEQIQEITSISKSVKDEFCYSNTSIIENLTAEQEKRKNYSE